MESYSQVKVEVSLGNGKPNFVYSLHELKKYFLSGGEVAGSEGGETTPAAAAPAEGEEGKDEVTIDL